MRIQCAAVIKFPLIVQGTLAGDELEVFIEAGRIVEPTLITKLFYAEVVLYQ